MEEVFLAIEDGDLGTLGSFGIDQSDIGDLKNILESMDPGSVTK